MTASPCAREPELIDAVLNGRWPEAIDEDLRRHADCCVACHDTATIAPLLRADYLALRHQAPVPSAAHVWWRIMMRARMDAAREATRPATMAQGVAAAAAVGLLAALAGIVWPWVVAVLSWTAGALTHADPAAAQAGVVLIALLGRSLPLVIGAALCMLIAPVAVYLALSDD